MLWMGESSEKLEIVPNECLDRRCVKLLQVLAVLFWKYPLIRHSVFSKYVKYNLYYLCMHHLESPP